MSHHKITPDKLLIKDLDLNLLKTFKKAGHIRSGSFEVSLKTTKRVS